METGLTKTEGGSFVIGTLPEGCKRCIKGEKMVLFIGGLCQFPARCSWYCPLSKERRGRAGMYADEIAIRGVKEAIEEALTIGATGMGITGGDPLYSEEVIKKVLYYIKTFRNEFGDKFHIHLYTNGINFNKDLGERLYTVGLDEIRFHPDYKDFDKPGIAASCGLVSGAEVPAIPTPENRRYLKELALRLERDGCKFLNLNEFEINGPNAPNLRERGFELEEGEIAAVKGSRKFALGILKNLYSEKIGISVHFCTVSLKDGVQLRNRYIRRAERIKKPYEEVTDDGTLLFLKVRGSKKKLAMFARILREYGLPNNRMELICSEPDEGELRLPPDLSADRTFRKLIKKNGLEAGVSEILPFRGEKEEECEYTPLFYG